MPTSRDAHPVDPSALTVAQAVAAARRGVAQLVALLHGVADPTIRVSPEWTVRDVAAHLAGGMPDYVAIARGEGSPIASIDEVAAFNAAVIATVTEPDFGVLVARIDAAVQDAIAAVTDAADDQTVPWHGSISVPVSTATALIAAECYIHGWDIAKATGSSFEVATEDARAIIRGVIPLLPLLVVPEATAGLRARILVRLRGGHGERWLLTFRDSALAVTPPDGERVDCTIWADPAAFLLSSYSRVGPGRVALTGKVTAWGRRPMLAFRLSSYLASP